MILVERQKHRRDDALTERVSQRVVYRLRQDAVARGGVAVDGDVEQRSGVRLVAGDVGYAGNGFELVEEDRRPVVDLAGVGVDQRVLVLRPGHAGADRDVLRRLQGDWHALQLGP